MYIYIIDKFYKIYIPVFGDKFDYLNNSTFWKSNERLTYKNIVIKYIIIMWRRVIFKGKGFRVRIFKENKKITLNFGYSHWTKIKFINNWDMLKLYRQNYLVFTNSMLDFFYFLLFFPTIKKMNRYTLRGLRLKKQTIKRRYGKISQYISSLH